MSMMHRSFKITFCLTLLAYISTTSAMQMQQTQEQEQATQDNNADNQENTELHGLITQESAAEQEATVEQHTCSFVHAPCDKCECTGCATACEYCPSKHICTICHREQSFTERMQRAAQSAGNELIRIKNEIIDDFQQIKTQDVVTDLASGICIGTAIVLGIHNYSPNPEILHAVGTAGIATEVVLIGTLITSVIAHKYVQTPIYDHKKYLANIRKRSRALQKSTDQTL